MPVMPPNMAGVSERPAASTTVALPASSPLPIAAMRPSRTSTSVPFKVPRAVVFGELPKTSTGKIQKFELRKQAGSAAAIDV